MLYKDIFQPAENFISKKKLICLTKKQKIRGKENLMARERLEKTLELSVFCRGIIILRSQVHRC